MTALMFEMVFAAPPDERSDGARHTTHDTARDASRVRPPLDAVLEQLRAGEVAAFDELVLTYDAPLRAFARRMLHDPEMASDIVQDVFAWMWEHRDTVHPNGTLRSYLYGAVRHRALHVLRRARIEEACTVRIDPAFGVPGMAVPAPGTSAAVERAEMAAALTRALDALSPRVRQVALLRWRDRLSRAEIAGVMNVAVPTVNNQLTQAARVVRSLLGVYLSNTE